MPMQWDPLTIGSQIVEPQNYGSLYDYSITFYSLVEPEKLFQTFFFYILWIYLSLSQEILATTLS